MAVPLLAHPGHLAGGDLQARRTRWWCRAGRSRGCACSACPGCIGNVFWVRFNAWIWLFVRHEALHYRMEVRGLHPGLSQQAGEAEGSPGRETPVGWEQP